MNFVDNSENLPFMKTKGVVFHRVPKEPIGDQKVIW